MFQTSEIARLFIALTVLPFILWYWRRLRLPRWRWLNLFTAAAIYVSYVLTILEEYFWEDLLNAAQHTLIGAAGVTAFVSAVYAAREIRREAGEGR